MIKTTVITVSRAIKDGHYKWNKLDNDIDNFYENVDGYIPGFCVEYRDKNDNIEYGSMICTRDYENIKIPEVDENWNDLGINVNMVSYKGYMPTGRIVFRGYFTEVYDPREREMFIEDASKEVVKLVS